MSILGVEYRVKGEPAKGWFDVSRETAQEHPLYGVAGGLGVWIFVLLGFVIAGLVLDAEIGRRPYLPDMHAFAGLLLVYEILRKRRGATYIAVLGFPVLTVAISINLIFNDGTALPWYLPSNIREPSDALIALLIRDLPVALYFCLSRRVMVTCWHQLRADDPLLTHAASLGKTGKPNVSGDASAPTQELSIGPRGQADARLDAPELAEARGHPSEPRQPEREISDALPAPVQALEMEPAMDRLSVFDDPRWAILAKYDPEAEASFQALGDLGHDWQALYIERCLASTPERRDPAEIGRLVRDDHDEFWHLSDDPAINRFFKAAHLIGPNAGAAFKEIYDVLGDKMNAHKVLSDIERDFTIPEEELWGFAEPQEIYFVGDLGFRSRAKAIYFARQKFAERCNALPNHRKIACLRLLGKHNVMTVGPDLSFERDGKSERLPLSGFGEFLLAEANNNEIRQILDDMLSQPAALRPRRGLTAQGRDAMGTFRMAIMHAGPYLVRRAEMLAPRLPVMAKRLTIHLKRYTRRLAPLADHLRRLALPGSRAPSSVKSPFLEHQDRAS